MEKYNKLISGDNYLDMHTKFKNKINIVYGDLRNFKDECVVNAANELLLGGGGVDGIIHELGGEKLLDEIKKIPLNNYGCRIFEGEAVLTNGYNSLYSKIIHTVAPYYDNNNMMKHSVMEKCFDSIFDIVKKNNIKSLTIVPIGTGFYGFHMYDFTVICMQKICEYLNNNIEKITLITTSKLQYNYYRIILDDYVHE
jgi:hypothetical protein